MKAQKKERVIGIRLTPLQYQDINRLAGERYLTASTLGRLLFEKYLKNEIRIKGIIDTEDTAR
jgi:hypothetical protein